MTEAVDAEERAARADRLKERIYIAFATLAVLIAAGGHGSEALEVLLTLLITVGGLVAAVFLADLLSHLVVHSRLPSARELRGAVGASFGATLAPVAPALLLLGAVLGWWSTEAGIIAGQVCVILGLVAVGYLAVRNVPMRWWQRILAIGLEALLGVVVIVIQVLAHG
ncbi:MULTISPECIES: hypothetical protein [unclassified Microbacterium]|uniref:hypothetical protein n=1 Tax=unclassified Microbacterium TaxID=2609290 RepID=UPI00364DCD26